MKLPRLVGTSRKVLAAGALVLAGAAGGAALAATGVAGAASDSSGSADTDTRAESHHGDEIPLTGTTADKVRAAALATYPGATIDRLETDSDGVYEAHLTSKTGEELVVQVDKSFAVTGTQEGRGHGDTDGTDDRGGWPGGGHGDETQLSGTTANKVRAAALAAYPGATIERLETNSDGVYEAHLTTKAGEELTVQVDRSFAVTGTQTRGDHGHGHP